MKKLLYISTGIPKEEVKRLQEKQFNFSSNALLPISVFHGNILDGLSNSYDEITALSAAPISNRIFKIKRYCAPDIVQNKVTYTMPSFWNYPIIKQITVIAKMFCYIISWCNKNKADEKNIIIDGTFFGGLISLWFAKKIKKVKTSAIIVDMYPFMDPSRKKISQKVYHKLLKVADSFVFVTEQLAELINLDRKPYMIMEGLVNAQNVERAEEVVENLCIYAGGLQEIYGVRNLVDAFHESTLSCSLHLYGNGDVIEYIKEISRIDARIEYKGLVSHEELLAIERSAKLLINPRPVDGKLDTRYNFPSKLMEYMQAGRPVITTRLRGIPKEYDEYMYFFEGDTKDDIKKGLEKVLMMDEQTLSCFGRAARKYVNENKNSVVVANKIYCLINKERVQDERTV